MTDLTQDEQQVRAFTAFIEREADRIMERIAREAIRLAIRDIQMQIDEEGCGVVFAAARELSTRYGTERRAKS